MQGKYATTVLRVFDISAWKTERKENRRNALYSRQLSEQINSAGEIPFL